MFDDVFTEFEVFPRIKNIFQQFVITLYFLLITIGKLLNTNTAHQFFNIFI